MKHFYKLIKPIFTTLAGLASLDGYRRAIANDKEKANLNQAYNNLANKLEEVKKAVEAKEDELLSNQVATEARSSLELVVTDSNNLATAAQNNISPELIKTTSESLVKSSNKAFEDLQKKY